MAFAYTKNRKKKDAVETPVSGLTALAALGRSAFPPTWWPFQGNYATAHGQRSENTAASLYWATLSKFQHEVTPSQRQSSARISSATSSGENSEAKIIWPPPLRYMSGPPLKSFAPTDVIASMASTATTMRLAPTTSHSSQHDLVRVRVVSFRRYPGTYRRP